MLSPLNFTRKVNKEHPESYTRKVWLKFPGPGKNLNTPKEIVIYLFFCMFFLKTGIMNVKINSKM